MELFADLASSRRRFLPWGWVRYLGQRRATGVTKARRSTISRECVRASRFDRPFPSFGLGITPQKLASNFWGHDFVVACFAGGRTLCSRGGRRAPPRASLHPRDFRFAKLAQYSARVGVFRI
jgi:hypothetical protein